MPRAFLFLREGTEPSNEPGFQSDLPASITTVFVIAAGFYARNA